MAANYLIEPNSFCGDYFYQPSKQDACDPEMLTNKMEWILRELKENRRIKPRLVILIIYIYI